MENTIPRLVSKSAPGKPIGWMSEADWQHTIKILRETGRVQTDLKLDQLYTNALVPTS